MKTKILLSICVALSAGVFRAEAQGTVFTYQGRLNDGAGEATGVYDLRFSIYDLDANGSLVAGPLTNAAIAVSNGLFTVALDFGNGPFTSGAPRWLEIGARTNGNSAFTTLNPRQQLTPTPYAITAGNVTGVVPNAGLSGTYGSALTFNNPGNSFSGNGAGLVGVNASTLGGLSASTFWRTTGNGGTSPAANFLGTTDNQALELRANGRRAFRLQPNAGAGASVIGGSNTVDATVVAATIGGGENNLIQNFSDRATISGGYSNQLRTSPYATIAGGFLNTIQDNGFYSTIGGGRQNSIENSAQQVNIAGGIQNRIAVGANSSAIGGGWENVIQSSVGSSVIAGGHTNSIGPSLDSATIAGGYQNSILSGADYSAIGGGRFNSIQDTADYGVIAGGGFNSIQSGTTYSTISGGDGNTIQAISGVSAIGGGAFNVIRSGYSFIGGGYNNTIDPSSENSAIGGGTANGIHTNANSSTIAGGTLNHLREGANFSFIGGGSSNEGQSNAYYVVIAGGSNNRIQTNAQYSTISGGQLNTISPSAAFSTVGGGKANTIANFAQYSTIPGGGGNVVAGNLSFAAGAYAQANHDGTFVWADNSAGFVPFPSSNSNQFLIRAAGGVGIGTSTPGSSLEVNGGIRARGGAPGGFGLNNNGYAFSGNGGDNDSGMFSSADGQIEFYSQAVEKMRIASSGNVGIGLINPTNRLHVAGGISATAFVGTSDRNAKENFAPVSPRDVLTRLAALPITTWSFKELPGARHMGPTAQDFYAAFNLGGSDTTITTVDPDGVALAAIQGLNQKLEERQQVLEHQLKDKDERINDLETRLSRLEHVLSASAAKR